MNEPSPSDVVGGAPTFLREHLLDEAERNVMLGCELLRVQGRIGEMVAYIGSDRLAE